MPSQAEFNRYLSIPRSPSTSLGPGQFFDYAVQSGKKVVITDIYVENLGGGDGSQASILVRVNGQLVA